VLPVGERLTSSIGTNLDDTMAVQRVEPRCLGIDDDFTR
jgi:hypothetical protein